MDVLIYLQQNHGFFLGLITVIGLLVGSFLNVVIYRLPIMMEKDWRQQCLEFLGDDATIQTTISANESKEHESKTKPFNLAVPASTCPKCQHQIRAWENIPVISYLFLKGKCSNCSNPISVRYPIIESVCGLLSLSVALKFGFSIETGFALILCWSLIALTVIDFDHKLLPDSITLPCLWLGLLLSLYGVFTDSSSAIVGAVAGYLSLWSVFQVFKLVTGKEGMGYGDFKLLAMLGAWMGWQMILPIILLSSMVGAVVGISLIIFLGRDKNIPIPFGPYLASAGFIAFIWGDTIMNFYWALFSPA